MNTRISDLQFARMRRRWPAIAEAMDPELVAFFIGRRPQKAKGALRGVARLFKSIMTVLLCLLLIVFTQLIGIVIVLAMSPWSRMKNQGFIDQPAKLFLRRHHDKIHDVWMTPLTARQWLAIEVGRMYFDWTKWIPRAAGMLCWMMVGGAVFFGMTAADFFQGREEWGRIVFAAGLAMNWFAGALFILGDDLYIQSSVNVFHLTLRRNQLDRFRSFIAGDLGKLLAAVVSVVLVIAFIMALASFLDEVNLSWIPFSWGGWGVVLGAVACLLAWFRFRWLPKLTNWQFNWRAAACEHLYQRLVRAKAGD